ncbi:MAG: CYTH domain-containing protein [Firmicutes bacterium]|nr:CYTH domain-containing protein [Bacillota bacterium]
MEIERKFIVKYLPEGIDDAPYTDIRQSYISVEPVIRIRKADDEYILTIKGRGDISREEKEIFISRQEYENLRKKTETREVVKRRYFYPLEDGHTAEIDIYEGELDGFRIVEVEFESLEEAEAFTPPDFFGKDVSRIDDYKNVKLALYGIPKDKT